MNNKLFFDLEIDDVIQLESALQNFFRKINSIDGRQSILEAGGVDQYFIDHLDWNLKIIEFIPILVSKFKDYKLSSQKPDYHPLVAFLDYILKQPQRYNLSDEDIEIFKKILIIGQQRIEAFVASLLSSNKQLLSEFLPLISENQLQSSRVDILIITALKDELDALKNCDNNSGISWQESQDSLGYSYYKISFRHIHGTDLNIAAASAVDMGETKITELATRLVLELKPHCLAMTGVCAGDKDEVFLGDVIVADRVFKFDYGKLVAHYQELGEQKIRTEEIFYDITTYNLKPLWKSKIQNFSQDWINTIQSNRPKSYFHQERWLIHKLYDYQESLETNLSPQVHPEQEMECPDWEKVIRRLRMQKLLQAKSFKLTAKGNQQVEEERLNYLGDRPKDPLTPKIHIGVIATTSQVQKDPEIFQRLKKLQRKALGVEMEVAAIGAVAEIHDIPMIVVKSVQDYADYDKNDQFRLYAAETSARFLLAFLTTVKIRDQGYFILDKEVGSPVS